MPGPDSLLLPVHRSRSFIRSPKLVTKSVINLVQTSVTWDTECRSGGAKQIGSGPDGVAVGFGDGVAEKLGTLEFGSLIIGLAAQAQESRSVRKTNTSDMLLNRSQIDSWSVDRGRVCENVL